MSHYKSKTMKHEHGESQQVKTCQCLRPTFVIASQAAEACRPRKRALHHPSPGQQDKTALPIWQFDHLQTHAMSCCGLRWLITGISLIDICQLDGASGHFLHGGCQFLHLGSILLIGWGDMQSQQIAQRVHRRVDLTAFASLGSIVTCSVSTLWSRLQGSAIKNGSRWLLVASSSQPQHRPQIVDDSFKATGFEPTLRLLVDNRPGRQVMRHHAPLRSRSYNPAKTIKHFSQGVLSLWGIFRHQGQVRGHEAPFFIADIARVWCSVHTPECTKSFRDMGGEQTVMPGFLSISRRSSKVQNRL